MSIAGEVDDSNSVANRVDIAGSQPILKEVDISNTMANHTVEENDVSMRVPERISDSQQVLQLESTQIADDAYYATELASEIIGGTEPDGDAEFAAKLHMQLNQTTAGTELGASSSSSSSSSVRPTGSMQSAFELNDTKNKLEEHLATLKQKLIEKYLPL
jgi:hypothetical protein